MKLGENGVAFFVEKISEEEDIAIHSQLLDDLGSSEKINDGSTKPKSLPVNFVINLLKLELIGSAKCRATAITTSNLEKITAKRISHKWQWQWKKAG